MIPDTVLGRIVHSSGIGDASLVQLDVLSVYLLEELRQSGMLDHMCFKGGNSLRKIIARRPSRFSRDLDFVDASYHQTTDAGITVEDYYLKLLDRLDAKTYHDIHWRLIPLNDEDLKGDTLHVDAHFFTYGKKPEDGWEKVKANVLAFQCSFRRPILLPPQLKPLREESWFKDLEFKPGDIPVLQLEEAIAEKVRAAFQRTNPRDLFDLFEYGKLTFDEELLRSLSILKCWQDRGLYAGKQNFDPDEFFGKLNAESYNWNALKGQVAKHAWIDPKELIATVKKRFEFLNALPEIETALCVDRAQKRQDLHDQVWAACKTRIQNADT
jgi:predicted nucleotidyltransferase component of viral defense system